jgi:hypothetical protein
VPAAGGQAKWEITKSKSLQGRSTVLFTVLNIIKANYRTSLKLAMGCVHNEREYKINRFFLLPVQPAEKHKVNKKFI